MLFLSPLNTSHSTHAFPRTSPLFSLPSARRPPPCLSCPGQAASVHISDFKRHTPALHRHARNYKRQDLKSAQGEISMVNNAQGHIARTRPIDSASANYDIEINLAANTGTVRQELCFHTRGTEIRSRHTRTSTAANSAAKPLLTPSASSAKMTRAMVPHYGKPPCIPSCRDNHAPRRAMFAPPHYNTLRGPPGSSRRPRAWSKQRNVDWEMPPACECRVNARLRRRLTRKQMEKNKRKGTGGIDHKSHPQSREQGTR